MENNKKILVPTIIAVVTLILLAFGATYAYFTVGSTNNFGTKDLNANIQDMAGAVVLSQETDTLSLNVTRAMMSQDNAGTAYYASGSEKPANIAKISVTGEGKYACDYTISITKSASSEENDLHTVVKNHRFYTSVYYRLNDSEFGLYYGDFPKTYNGTAYGITENRPQYITANMSIKNLNSNQNVLKGKDITLTFEVTNFDCYLQEVDESVPIYAIYQEESWEYDEEGNELWFPATLAFYQNIDEVNVGDTYDGYKVTEVYKNLNHTNYMSIDDVPWDFGNIYMVVIEDIISPENTAYWFAGSCITNIDGFKKIDTSKVTNMSHMFDGASFGYNSSDLKFNFSLLDFDTSKVTDMSYMFTSIEAKEFDPDISRWNTSNVTNMSGMFASAAMNGDVIVDLSTWDTSKVTDMSSMFENAGAYGEFNVGNITRREVTANGKTYIAWDTSKVTDMSYMFADAGIDSEYNLDLRSWQVPLVTMYEDFNFNSNGMEFKITPPNWVN